MAVFRKMVSMEQKPAEMREAYATDLPASVADQPVVPYGLRICLTDVELSKLDLEEEAQVGDTVHLFCLAKVTSVSKNDMGDGEKLRVELAITDMAVESEDAENQAARPNRKARYG